MIERHATPEERERIRVFTEKTIEDHGADKEITMTLLTMLLMNPWMWDSGVVMESFMAATAVVQEINNICAPEKVN